MRLSPGAPQHTAKLHAKIVMEQKNSQVKKNSNNKDYYNTKGASTEDTATTTTGTYNRTTKIGRYCGLENRR